MKCTDCFAIVQPGMTSCPNCGCQEFFVKDGSSTSVVSSGELDSGRKPVIWNSLASTPKSGQLASRRIRFGAMLIDLAIAGLTCAIGWLIWFILLAPKGQTPAKRILKLRLVTDSGATPKTSVTLLRYFIPNLLNWLIAPFGFLGLLSLPYALAFILGFLEILAWIVPTVDGLFILGQRKKRLVDYMFKTKVVYQ